MSQFQFFKDDEYGYVGLSDGRTYRYWFEGLETDSEWQAGDPMPAGQIRTEIEEVLAIPATAVADKPGEAEQQAIERAVGAFQPLEGWS